MTSKNRHRAMWLAGAAALVGTLVAVVTNLATSNVPTGLQVPLGVPWLAWTALGLLATLLVVLVMAGARQPEPPADVPACPEPHAVPPGTYVVGAGGQMIQGSYIRDSTVTTGALGDTGPG